VNKKRKSRFFKIGLLLAALFLIASSALSILAGKLNYSNYWGGVVFAPVALFIGVLMFIVILRSGKRAAPKSELLDSPVKDYHKW